MRILLDEDLPRRLAPLLIGHRVTTVPQAGWAGVKNGELLRLAASGFDLFLTMDRNIEFQQNLAELPLPVLVIVAASNRMEHLVALLPDILAALTDPPSRGLRKVCAPMS
jgi:hypothetical protein